MGMLTGAMILVVQLWQAGDHGRAIDCGMVRWVDPNIDSAARVVNLHPTLRSVFDAGDHGSALQALVCVQTVGTTAGRVDTHGLHGTPARRGCVRLAD